VWTDEQHVLHHTGDSHWGGKVVEHVHTLDDVLQFDVCGVEMMLAPGESKINTLAAFIFHL